MNLKKISNNNRRRWFSDAAKKAKGLKPNETKKKREYVQESVYIK